MVDDDEFENYILENVADVYNPNPAEKKKNDKKSRPVLRHQRCLALAAIKTSSSSENDSLC